MILSVNQILVICLIVVLVAMLVVLGILAVKGIALMKSLNEFTDEYGRLASKAEEVIDDVKATVHEGAEVFNKSMTVIALTSLILNLLKKVKKIKKNKDK